MLFRSHGQPGFKADTVALPPGAQFLSATGKVEFTAILSKGKGSFMADKDKENFKMANLLKTQEGCALLNHLAALCRELLGRLFASASGASAGVAAAKSYPVASLIGSSGGSSS